MRTKYHQIKSGLKEIADILFTRNKERLGELASNTKTLSADLFSNIKRPLHFALYVILAFVLLFWVWGGTALMDSAATAVGTIVVGGNQQVIQHLEGGIISEILVSDGDRVSKGQALIKLNGTRASSELAIARIQVIANLLIKERIVAEQKLQDKIAIPSGKFYDLIDLSDKEVVHLLDAQRKILKEKNLDFRVRKETLAKTINLYAGQIAGTNERIKNVKERVKIAKERYKDFEIVYKKNSSISEHELMEEKRRYNGEEEQLTALVTELHRLSEQKTVTESQYNELTASRDLKISEEYKENYKSLLDAIARYENSSDVLKRTVIRAPIDGFVSDLKYHTIGGVINSSTPIMTIISKDDELLVDAFVPTVEVVHLQQGMKAKIQLLSYNVRLVPRLDGEVIYVSPDKVGSNKSDAMGKPAEMFNVKIRLNRAQLHKLNYQVKILPGMPVNVFIVRGERTFMQYILAPLVNSFHKSFTEE